MGARGALTAVCRVDGHGLLRRRVELARAVHGIITRLQPVRIAARQVLMTIIIPVLALLLGPRPGRVLRLRLGLCAEDEERREADGGRRERDPVAGLHLYHFVCYVRAKLAERCPTLQLEDLVLARSVRRRRRRTRGDALSKCGRAVCLASLAVRRCRTSNHCSVATKQASDATRACLGAVVLAVSLASLQRLCATCCCYARDAQEHPAPDFASAP